MKPINYEQVLHRLAAYCSRGERCMADVRKKMDAWDVSPSDQKKILSRLQKEDFLNEERYCKAFVNDKSKYSQWGAYKIKYALMQKNIPENIISDALQRIHPQETISRLNQLLEKKKKTLKGNNEYEIKQKLMRFATGRGYTPEEIQKALDSKN
ncbi:MAG: RecX family transcriptional regulator [Dysgonamonadaceae bacterium]|jgi:regulatory protein|nr:RecX family transcriptional regulator [Dysgonamonadaceae bacterium]